jgi:hypothetical protein
MDNYYPNCPAKMDDGRFLTDYRTASTREEATKQGLHIVRNDDYRVYLQTKGVAMVDKIWHEERLKDSCINNACAHQYPLRQNPKDFVHERRQAELLLTARTLPASMTCIKYDDYRAWE